MDGVKNIAEALEQRRLSGILTHNTGAAALRTNLIIPDLAAASSSICW
jgi:hypothetical protein